MVSYVSIKVMLMPGILRSELIVIRITLDRNISSAPYLLRDIVSRNLVLLHPWKNAVIELLKGISAFCFDVRLREIG